MKILRNVGVTLISLTAVLALVAVFYTPFDPDQMNMALRLAKPGPVHWLGTDQFGRDVLSRLMIASKNAYTVGLISVLIGALAGSILGSIGGYVRGWGSEILMRFIDGIFAFPHLLLAMIIIAVLGSGKINALAAIALFNVPVFARLSYGMVRETKQALFVKAAQTYGAGAGYILFRHIFPVTFHRLITQATSSFGIAIMTEASLSFLGLGIQLPEASWGGMLEESRKFMELAPWFPFIPGTALLITVLGGNLIGDSLRKRRGEA